LIGIVIAVYCCGSALPQLGESGEGERLKQEDIMRKSIKRFYLLASLIFLAGLGFYGSISGCSDSTTSDLAAPPPLEGLPQETITVAPANLQVVAGIGQVTVSWDSLTGATSYNLYWGEAAGSTTNKIENAASPYVHTGLTNGTTYYYVVTAANSLGEGPKSAEASAIPFAVVSDTTPPQISSLIPANEATGVQTNLTVKVGFNKDMNADTILAASLTLTNPAGVNIISSSVSYDPAADVRTATFTFATRLEQNTLYHAEVVATVTDTSGNPLADPRAWEFTTGSGFGPVVEVDITEAQTREPKVGIDNIGDAVVMWQQNNPVVDIEPPITAWDLLANIYSVERGWREVPLELDNTNGDVADHQMAVWPQGGSIPVRGGASIAINGTVLAVWEQNNPDDTSPEVPNLYAGGFSIPTDPLPEGSDILTLRSLIEIGDLAVRSPQVAVSRKLPSVIAWNRTNAGGTFTIVGTNFPLGNIDLGSADEDSQLAIAIQRSGDNAIAVWMHGRALYAKGRTDRRWAAGDPTSISGTGTPPSKPKVTIAAGKAIVVWIKGGNEIWYSYFGSDAGADPVWHTATKLYPLSADGSANISDLQLVSCGPESTLPCKQGVISWVQDDWIMVANYATLGSPAHVNSVQGDIYSPKLVMNNAGTAYMVWVQDNKVMARRFGGVGTVSELPIVLSTVDIDRTTTAKPDIAVNDAGSAIISWAQNGSIQTVMFR